ncbi:MAG TPA: hypothetical protein VII38_22630 [Polyangia bacterium]
MHGVVLLAVLKLTLQLEVGPEWDSNANRAELVQGAANVDTPTASFLVRSTAAGALAWRHGRNALRLSGVLGGKVFFNPAVQDQNVLVGQLAAEDRVRVARWLQLGLSTDYYDAGQQNATPPCAAAGCNRHRDFRSGQALARLVFVDDPGELTLFGGYRGFQWKPDPSFDFQAGQATLLAAIHLTAGAEHQHEFDLSVSYHFERRLYQSVPEVDICAPSQPLTDMCLAPASGERADWFHEGSVELSWLRWVLLSAAYGLQLNQSNSFGQSLLRHLFTLKVAARLPWQLYLTLKGQLLVTKYLDPILLDQQVSSQTFISIEDENRNAFIVDLDRPIGETGLAVDARYSLYTNELSASPVSFLRQVVYLGITYRAKTR